MNRIALYLASGDRLEWDLPEELCTPTLKLEVDRSTVRTFELSLEAEDALPPGADARLYCTHVYRECLPRAESRPVRSLQRHEPRERIKGTTTHVLDCMGFDPDAVLEKLQKVANTIYVSRPHNEPAGSILGWPLAFERVKDGIEVVVEWLEVPVFGKMVNFAGLAEKDFLDLSIAGWRKLNGDFDINYIVAQPKGKVAP